MSTELRNGYTVTPETQQLKEKLALFITAYIKKAGWNSVSGSKHLKCAGTTVSKLIANDLGTLSIDYMLKLLIRIGASVSFDSGKLIILLPKNNVYSAIAINMSEEKIDKKVYDLKKLVTAYLVENVKSADITIRDQADQAGVSHGRLYDLVREYNDLVAYSFEYVLMVARNLGLTATPSIRYKV